SPIYAISGVLAALLAATGIGSLGSSRIARGLSRDAVAAASALLLVYLFLMTRFGRPLCDAAMALPFAARMGVVGALLMPAGVLLGLFFPLGLRVLGAIGAESIPWAWAINCGFTVLGSILSVIIAQFLGFDAVLMLAGAMYLAGALAFGRLEASRNPAK